MHLPLVLGSRSLLQASEPQGHPHLGYAVYVYEPLCSYPIIQASVSCNYPLTHHFPRTRLPPLCPPQVLNVYLGGVVVGGWVAGWSVHRKYHMHLVFPVEHRTLDPLFLSLPTFAVPPSPNSRQAENWNQLYLEPEDQRCPGDPSHSPSGCFRSLLCTV